MKSNGTKERKMENVNFIFLKKGQVYTTQCFQSVDSCVFIIILCIFLCFFFK